MPFAEKAVADTGVGGTATFKNKRRFKAVLILWNTGYLWPADSLCGHLARVCLRLFPEERFGGSGATGVDRLCFWCHGCCVYLEPADSCYGSILRGGSLAFLPAVIGFWAGILFLLGLDHLIPHLHQKSHHAEGPHTRLRRSTMMVLAVTLHNIPEGMAVGVVYAAT